MMESKLEARPLAVRNSFSVCLFVCLLACFVFLCNHIFTHFRLAKTNEIQARMMNPHNSTRYPLVSHLSGGMTTQKDTPRQQMLFNCHF